jgi:hypothetical protein
MLNRLTATQFIRVMTSGRTSPLLCGCVGPNGSPAGEFVVKLIDSKGALFEAVGSRLATHFGILVPEPAVVQVDQDFADLVSEFLSRYSPPLQLRAGLKFGSKVISPMSTWLIDRSIPEAMFRDATNIFAFDALVQNPDRRAVNPNLLTQRDDIYVYDHETSFSFLLAIGPLEAPWKLEREGYLNEHVFYSRLRSKQIDLADFEERLNDLTGDVLTEIRNELPSEWMHADFERIETHLLAVRSQSERFIEQVRRRLV